MKLSKFEIELTEDEEYEQSEKHVFVKVCLDLNGIKTPVVDILISTRAHDSA